jgi:hypothetical protein
MALGDIVLEVIRVKRDQGDGTYLLEMKLSDEQVAFLVTFAMNQLVNQGVASFIDIEEAQEDEEDDDEGFPQLDKSKLN